MSRSYIFLFPRAAWEYRHSALRCVPLAQIVCIPTQRVGTRATHLETVLCDHLQQFLLELGKGFTFVGRQYRITLANIHFLVPTCCVGIQTQRAALCTASADSLHSHAARGNESKNQTVVEYSLAGYTKPIGVAQWERYITQSLPDDLKASLPSVEEIEVELSGDSDD